MKNENKFDKVADVYEKYRQEYPKCYIDEILKKSKVNEKSIIADIGAGTGILTKQLLDENKNVIAVEPNDDMREQLILKLKEYSNCEIINATAEDTKIEDNSIELITVGQAFQWFDVEKFKKECTRILKKEGKIALVWNTPNIENEIVRKMKNIDKKYCSDYDEQKEITKKAKREISINKFFEDGEYESKVIKNDYKFNLEEFIGYNLTKSCSLRKDDEKFEEYKRCFEKLFNEYNKDGIITVANDMYGYLGKIKK